VLHTIGLVRGNDLEVQSTKLYIYIYIYIYIYMIVYVLRSESLYNYKASETRCRQESALIHVNITMFVNIILHRCTLNDSKEKRRGAYSTKKGKNEG
jgi:hypothetical protein